MGLKIALVFALHFAILIQMSNSKSAPVAVFHGLGDSVNISKIIIKINLVHLPWHESINRINSKRSRWSCSMY